VDPGLRRRDGGPEHPRRRKPCADPETRTTAPLDTINVLSFLAPDNEFMGASVTQALVNAINGEAQS